MQGGDRSMVQVGREDMQNEIDVFQDMRSVGACKTAYRVLGFNIHERSPGVHCLPVHLERKNFVLFHEHNQAAAVCNPATRKTELTEFFEHNKLNPTCRTIYVNFPEEFCWNKEQKKWKRRQQFLGTIGRVHSVSPVAGDVFYQRILLHNAHCAGY